MRVLSFVCGISVLFASLRFAHIIHHFSTHAPINDRTPGFWAFIVAASIACIFSFIGGFLLLRRAR